MPVSTKSDSPKFEIKNKRRKALSFFYYHVQTKSLYMVLLRGLARSSATA